MKEIYVSLTRLLREVPADRTVAFGLSAAEMIKEIEAESEIGKQYLSDLLRISRDYLIRTSKLKE
jgi:hypothetical protein